MAIKADYHLHSIHSADSTTPIENMVLAGIQKGLQYMCFTEHMDYDFPDSPDLPGSDFELNVDSYLFDLIKSKKKYADKLDVFFGIEIGMQPHTAKKNSLLARSHDFDLIIASLHVCSGSDPYYPDFFSGKTDKEAYGEYFASIRENLKTFQNFDVLGHLDYIVRYGTTMDKEYDWRDYQKDIDKILEFLVENEKGLEINTGSLKYGCQSTNPCMGIVKRFKELGGEYVTIGSDAHEPKYIAYEFEKAEAMLKDCGFQYYATYEKRIPELHRF